MLVKWKRFLDNEYNTGVHSIDLSKAFAILNCSLLLAKLDDMDIL